MALRWPANNNKKIQNEKNYKEDKKRLRAVTDEPTLEDALDFNRYSLKLSEIIINSKPRLTIGIFGGWGTGKTTLMKMIEDKLKNHDDILCVWFDAWKYEKEKYLAVIPFLRTVEIELENKLAQLYSREIRTTGDKFIEGWKKFGQNLEKTFDAFIKSTSLNIGIGNYGSAEINLGKFRDITRSREYTINNERIYYYHKHITDYLADALHKIREENPNCRIVVFIDDLDRCTPEKALEVLESIKTFFDIVGFVYVLGMDSKSIDFIVKEKYGKDTKVDGLSYLQKFVQLPFQLPTWKTVDVSKSISKIISVGLAGSELVAKFEKNKYLLVKAVQLNPRAVKRFINNIILAKAVKDKPVEELITVQALTLREEWNRFLDLITVDNIRKRFFNEYISLKKEDRAITKREELDKFSEDLFEAEYSLADRIVETYNEVLQHNNLRDFLDVGADEVLLNIDKMEEHRRALNTARLESKEEEITPIGITKITKQNDEQLGDLAKLLHEGKIEQYNKMRSGLLHTKLDFSYLNFSGHDLSKADLSYTDLSRSFFSSTDLSLSRLYGAKLYHANLFEANLSDASLKDANLYHAFLESAIFHNADLSAANLSRANLSDADLSNANLSFTNLSRAAFSRADLSAANLSRANLSGSSLTGADLSSANLRFSTIVGCKDYYGLTCVDADFGDAIIDDEKLIKYLHDFTQNVPELAARNKVELAKKLEGQGWLKFEIQKLLSYSSLPNRT